MIGIAIYLFVPLIMLTERSTHTDESESSCRWRVFFYKLARQLALHFLLELAQQHTTDVTAGGAQRKPTNKAAGETLTPPTANDRITSIFKVSYLGIIY
eukprot:scaffold15872_cov145-Skeletonema_menzelii.AAC.13